MSSIQSCGLYVPKNRIDFNELCAFYRASPREKVKALAIPSLDEDSVTMAFEAAETAMVLGAITPLEIGALIWCSMSPPFQKKSAGVLLSRALGLSGDIITLDFHSGTKAAGEALLAADSLVESGRIDKVLVVCSDFVPCIRDQVTTLPTSAGAAAVILGKKGFARLLNFSSSNSEVYDFWQAAGENRFRYDPAVYLSAFLKAAKDSLENLLLKTDMSPEMIDRLVFHTISPEKKMLKIADVSGILRKNAEDSLLTAHALGNLNTPSVLFNLYQSLESACKNDRIVSVAYGSGSSIGLLWEMTEEMPDTLKDACLLTKAMECKHFITVSQFQELIEL